MTFTKCDVCKKKLLQDEVQFSIFLSSNISWSENFIICLKCGPAIVALLTEHDLLSEDRPKLHEL